MSNRICGECGSKLRDLENFIEDWICYKCTGCGKIYGFSRGKTPAPAGKIMGLPVYEMPDPYLIPFEDFIDGLSMEKKGGDV